MTKTLKQYREGREVLGKPFPESDDWEYSDNDCPKCQSEMATRTCGSCGGDGYFEDEDDECMGRCDDRCENCAGQGHETWCRECGWGDNFKSFMSPEYERAWQKKQASATASAQQP